MKIARLFSTILFLAVFMMPVLSGASIQMNPPSSAVNPNNPNPGAAPLTAAQAPVTPPAQVPTQEVPAQAPASESAPSAPAAAAAEPIKDPCAAYKSYESYTVCQDRMEKIKRMKEAQGQRDKTYSPPPPAPAPAAAAPASTAPAPAAGAGAGG